MLSLNAYRILFFLCLAIKFPLWFLFTSYDVNIFGGGSDATGYNNFALGSSSEGAANLWPHMLRFLNTYGLYSRFGVSFFLMVLGFFCIPLVAAKLSTTKKKPLRLRTFWLVLFVVGASPTISFYTMDIYRDVFMFFCFLIVIWMVRCMLETRSLPKKAFSSLVALLISMLLLLLRPYLGISLILAMAFLFFFRLSRFPFIYCLLMYFAFLFIMFNLGVLDPVIAYRSSFEGIDGGSNLGINFLDGSSVLFLPKYILSFCYQVFGLYLTSVKSVMLFLSESFLFICAFIYIIKNKFFANRYVDFLMLFFVCYTTIWVLGNDNLGTAARLRVYSYLAVAISSCIIYQQKNSVSRKSAKGKVQCELL